jgi:hypothetical protein
MRHTPSAPPRQCTTADNHALAPPYVRAPLQYYGFPFNLGISHPQYVGSALTVWGLVALLWAPEVRPALVQVAAAWTGLYVATGIIESNC